MASILETYLKDKKVLSCVDKTIKQNDNVETYAKEVLLILLPLYSNIPKLSIEHLVETSYKIALEMEEYSGKNIPQAHSKCFFCTNSKPFKFTGI